MSAAGTIGLVLCTIGAAVTLLNFYLSFVRYPWFRIRGGAPDRYRNVSGLPLIGSLLLWIGAAFLHSYPVAMWSALTLSLFDTGGLHVFAVVLTMACLKSN